MGVGAVGVGVAGDGVGADTDEIVTVTDASLGR